MQEGDVEEEDQKQPLFLDNAQRINKKKTGAAIRGSKTSQYREGRGRKSAQRTSRKQKRGPPRQQNRDTKGSNTARVTLTYLPRSIARPRQR